MRGRFLPETRGPAKNVSLVGPLSQPGILRRRLKGLQLFDQLRLALAMLRLVREVDHFIRIALEIVQLELRPVEIRFDGAGAEEPAARLRDANPRGRLDQIEGRRIGEL